MSDWKRRWVEAIGDFMAQFETWEEHWLVLHPEDTPPPEVGDDMEEIFQNREKYLADPEVGALFRTYANVTNLDNVRRAREERERSAKLREDIGYVGVCTNCEVGRLQNSQRGRGRRWKFIRVAMRQPPLREN